MKGSQIPSLRTYAIASLIADTYPSAEVRYLEAQCRKRETEILLWQCREIVPGLMDVSCEGLGLGIYDVTYTFATLRFTFNFHFRPHPNDGGGHLNGYYTIKGYVDGGPEPMLIPQNAAVRRWVERDLTEASACPISLQAHARILTLLKKRNSL